MTYKDPLHVPSAQLVIMYKGREHLVLNKALLDRQNCWENLGVLKELHVKRLEIEELMSTVTFEDPKELVLGLNKSWTDLQFALQRAWGFPEDANFHSFWSIPACRCPKMDNNDAFPYGRYIISAGCPLHGIDIRTPKV